MSIGPSARPLGNDLFVRIAPKEVDQFQIDEISVHAILPPAVWGSVIKIARVRVDGVNSNLV
jgi:hypothetical protein